jgi:hypothetical protein
MEQLVRRNAAGSGIYGVFLPRKIDGMEFFGETEGFQFEFGTNGKVLGFCLQWPTLERDRRERVAVPRDIIRCIRARETPMMPPETGPDSGPGYFGAIANLGRAKKLTITAVMLKYGEGTYGEQPPDNEPSRKVVPVAELDAVADFGTSSAAARLYAPIVMSDVERVLANRAR